MQKLSLLLDKIKSLYKKVVIRSAEMTFGVIAAVFMLGLFFFNPQFFISENYVIFDALSPLYKGNQVAKELPIIVDIDRKTVNAFKQNSLPRYVIADLISKIADNGAIAIGFDMSVSSLDMTSPAELARALKRNKNINAGFTGIPKELIDYDVYLSRVVKRTPTVLPAYAERDKGSGRIKSDAKIKQVDFVVNYLEEECPDWLDFISDRAGIVLPVATLAENTPVGLVEFRADQDGKIRRVPLFLKSEGELYPVLAIRTLMMAEKTEKVILNIGERGLESAVVGKYTIPVGRRGSVRFPFTPGANNYEYISALEVIEGRAGKERLDGKIVFVGSLSSLRVNRVDKPSDIFYSTTELHAATLDAIMSQDRITTPRKSPIIQPGLMIFAAAVLLFVSRRYGFKIYLGATFVLAAAMTFFVAMLFKTGLFLTPAWVLGTLFLMLAVKSCIVGVRSAYERNSIYSTFSKYVSSDIVKILVKNNSSQIEGKEQDLSVMFVDIRRFTSISEKMKPNDIVDMLNKYFTFASGVVKKYNGTIDKFMGDGMLAFWNAPVEIDNHQYMALKAALEMQRKIKEFNKEIKDIFNLELEIGIAIHIAPTFVGNIGSQHLLSYTIIGDSVNLASRLEAMCKVYGVGIVVSETIKEAVSGEVDFSFRYLDKIRVYGKTQPVGVYSAMYKQDADAIADELKKYENAINLYLSKNFGDALKAFNELRSGRPDSVLYKLYIERTEYFIENPPEQDWDGCFTFASK